MEILNRQARHDYFIEEEYECGIVLTGTEIKSIRDGKCNLKDCYGIVRNNELYVLNMFISHYKEGNIFNHSETRSRKLLMHKNEIAILSSIDNYDGVIREESTLTSPESLELSKHIHNAVSSDIEHFVMEVSSQALKNNRVYNVLYNIGIFTNIVHIFLAGTGTNNHL